MAIVEHFAQYQSADAAKNKQELKYKSTNLEVLDFSEERSKLEKKKFINKALKRASRLSW
ncbi:hypothetical protein [Marinomonas fungiae]|uniref:Uncharacterized protein n=1 Tax=Marinomonas fungiae TaxID=1137284 RepID=A0A0K6IMF3_9GAMM|nr:hypothetical protein [Marinomonas fungiae]CUB04269.1 hypothetical protein Ga0061065_10688 [Marinomonas fungiae]